jgi:hypothetical protein
LAGAEIMLGRGDKKATAEEEAKGEGEEKEDDVEDFETEGKQLPTHIIFYYRIIIFKTCTLQHQKAILLLNCKGSTLISKNAWILEINTWNILLNACLTTLKTRMIGKFILSHFHLPGPFRLQKNGRRGDSKKLNAPLIQLEVWEMISMSRTVPFLLSMKYESDL